MIRASEPTSASTTPTSADRKPSRAARRLRLVELFADFAIESGLLSPPKGDDSKLVAFSRMVRQVAGSGGEPLRRQPANRIAVDLDAMTVSLDGTKHDVKSRQALRWIRVLSRRPGEWFSSTWLVECDKELLGARTDKLRRYLPPEVDCLIDSSPGTGSRLRLDAVLVSAATAGRP